MRRKVILGAVLAVAGLILFALVAYEGWDSGRGPYRTATITGKHVFHANSGDTYYIDFRYSDRDGGPHKMSTSASQSEYARAKDGNLITVRVAADDPSDATMDDEGTAGHVRAGLIGRAVLMGAAGAGLFIPGVWLFAANFRKRAQSAGSEIR